MNENILGILVSGIFGGFSGLLVFWRKLAQYKEKVDHLEKTNSLIEERLRHCEGKLTACETRLEEREPIKKYVQKKSPLSLTESGKELMQKTGADKFILDNKDHFVELIKARNPKSAYDIQTYARAVIEELNDKDEFVPFKDFAYREGLELEIINTVMGVYLRDIALASLNYRVEDIDEK